MEFKELDSPYSHRNWREYIAGKPLLEICEFPLLTDAHLTGGFDDDCGPYQFLDLVGLLPECGDAKPRFMLRFSRHIDVGITIEDMKKMRNEIYHGGNAVDEIAALVSLALGVRLKAGGLAREFRIGNGEDPRGVPMKTGFTRNPVIPMSGSNLVLPMSCGYKMNRDVGDRSKYFASFSSLSNSDATALVRAARLYQDAMWLVESEPSLSWVMFVSAMESAASHWRDSQGNSWDIVKEWYPDLYKVVKGSSDVETGNKIIEEEARKIKSTKRFVEFSMNFRPHPPLERPNEEWAQFSWEQGNFRATMDKIYKYRSRVLHDGQPFPAPMCQAPMKYSRGNLPEKPLGEGHSSHFGTWRKADVPILLHTYEYIVRESLLKWWESMIPVV